MIPFRDDVPARRYPLTTVCLIVANVAAFVYQVSLPAGALQAVAYDYGAVPQQFSRLTAEPDLLAPSFASLLTSMFLHGGFIHLLGNMWYLWIFGDNVEDRMGHVRFLFFYVICGLLASLTHIGFNLDSSLPTIGASGAVAGVLGAYLVSYPFARVLTVIPLLFLWPVVELPAIFVLGSWFLIQILNGTASIGVSSGGVAWWAHIGGFIAGVVLIGVVAEKRGRRSPAWRLLE